MEVDLIKYSNSDYAGSGKELAPSNGIIERGSDHNVVLMQCRISNRN